MADKSRRDENIEKIMNELAESVLGLSDETIIGEVREIGADPDAEVEQSRNVLRTASQVFAKMSGQLSSLGHKIDSNWQRGKFGYHSKCLNCGSSVRFIAPTGEVQGSAAYTPCRDSGQYVIRPTGTVS
jgi:hypothetical protein